MGPKVGVGARTPPQGRPAVWPGGRRHVGDSAKEPQKGTEDLAGSLWLPKRYLTTGVGAGASIQVRDDGQGQGLGTREGRRGRVLAWIPSNSCVCPSICLGSAYLPCQGPVSVSIAARTGWPLWALAMCPPHPPLSFLGQSHVRRSSALTGAR